jgi:hypothetical protein
MAKDNRTTSTARRATAAKATLADAETLCRLEDEGFAEVENLRHLSAFDPTAMSDDGDAQ